MAVLDFLTVWRGKPPCYTSSKTCWHKHTCYAKSAEIPDNAHVNTHSAEPVTASNLLFDDDVLDSHGGSDAGRPNGVLQNVGPCEQKTHKYQL